MLYTGIDCGFFYIATFSNNRKENSQMLSNLGGQLTAPILEITDPLNFIY